MKHRMGIVVACLGLLAVSLLAGCSDGSHSGDSDVQAGAWRSLTVGDEWVYTLTGNEGATVLNGVARAVVGTSTVNESEVEVAYWRLLTPIASELEGERWTAFFQEDDDGNILLVGLDTNWGLFSEAPSFNAVTNDAGTVAVGNTQTLDSTATYEFSVPIDHYENLTCDLTREGSENVTVGDTVYACYKYTGTLGVYVTDSDPGIVLTVTAWLCPEISGFARLQVSWNDGISHEYNYVLSSFQAASDN